ncbi:hypothetical protein EON83_26300 [bacterium]|nr:MAG: hypothetical protein EON83_26300 [bacterium]
MRPLLALFPLAFCAIAAHAQPNTEPSRWGNAPDAPVAAAQPVPPPVGPRPGTPQEQIKTDVTMFINNLNKGHAFMNNNGLVHGVNTGYFGANQWAKNWDALGVQIKLDDIIIDNTDGKTATVTIKYNAQAGPELLNELFKTRFKDGTSETLKLQKELMWGEEPWQIVPQEKDFDPAKPETGIFAYVAYVLAQKGEVPTDALPYTFNTEGARSINNLKQLCLGVLQFVQDYDEIYAFQLQYLQEAIMPYVKSTQIFRIPASQQSYNFNANLCGKNITTLAEPARTILFYEGDNQKPIFHYAGKAAIGFADGHCVLVSPEDFKNAIWEVKPAKN